MNRLLLTTALVAAFASSAVAAEKQQVTTHKKWKTEIKNDQKLRTAEKEVVEKKWTNEKFSPFTVTLGGSLNTQVGYNGQKSVFNTNDYVNAAMTTPANPVNKNQKYAIVNDTKLHVKVDGNAKGVKYGGKIVLNSDTSNNKFSLPEETKGSVAYQTMAYVESKMGRLEGGSTTGVYEAFKVNGSTIARATGGIDGDARYWMNQDFSRGAIDTNLITGKVDVRGSFITAPSLPTNYDNNKVANAAKVSFMLPAFSPFKIGVTYIPDTDQTGTVTTFHSVSRNNSTLPEISANSLRNNFRTSGYKNVFQGGFNYTGKFDKTTFKFAALGELGKAKNIGFQSQGNLAGVSNLNAKRHNLRAWEIGASANIAGFTLAGSYGDWGKSGLIKNTAVTNTLNDVVTTTNTDFGGKKTAKYWTAGIGYDYYNAMGMTLSYINSSAGGFGTDVVTNSGYSGSKGKYTAFSFGVDYKVAPGFMPYAEVTHFSMKDKAQVTPNATKNSGNIILAGTKLHF